MSRKKKNPEPPASPRTIYWVCRFRSCGKNFRIRTRRALTLTCPHCHRSQDGPGRIFPKYYGDEEEVAAPARSTRRPPAAPAAAPAASVEDGAPPAPPEPPAATAPRRLRVRGQAPAAASTAAEPVPAPEPPAPADPPQKSGSWLERAFGYGG